MLISSLPQNPPSSFTNLPIPYEQQTILCRLSATDQVEFMNLINFFIYTDDRNKRNLGMSTFVKHLNAIHDFVCKGDGNDALRGLLCGIEFSSNSFLIHTSRLKKLMYRSKSCMNGCFQKLGYIVCRPAQDISTLFSQILPGISPHCFSTRQWCVRKATEITTTHFTPNVNFEFVPHEVISPLPSITTLTSEPETFEMARSNPVFAISELLNHEVPRVGSAPSALPPRAPLFKVYSQ